MSVSALRGQHGLHAGRHHAPLDEHRRLVPREVLVGDLAVAEPDDSDGGDLHAIPDRRDAGQNPVHPDEVTARVHRPFHQAAVVTASRSYFRFHGT